MTIGVCSITYQAKRHLPKHLPPFLLLPLKPRVLVVNSSSNDGTVELAKEMGAETLVVPRESFNHGTTREIARRHLGTDIVVMVTPDAYAKMDTLEKLVAPLQKKQATIAYARQLPHVDASFFASFSREFNYPSQGEVRGVEDVQKYGAKTFFCSDSCAAYLNKALDEVGGFPPVLLGEDTVVTAKLLARGHKIAYVAESEIHHSHDYTLWQEFQRHFDIGLCRNEVDRYFPEGITDYGTGSRYVLELFEALMERPHLYPYAVCQTFAKFFGYLLGKHSRKRSVAFKQRFSSQDFYWTQAVEWSHRG